MSMTAFVACYLALTWLAGYQVGEVGTLAAFACGSLVTYVCAVYRKPEYCQLPRSSGDEEFLELLKKHAHKPNKKICAYCKIEKPEKARHCFICKRCVLEHDKHFLMLNNCIGKNNRCPVIAYLAATSALMGLIILSTIFHYADVLDLKAYAEAQPYGHTVVSIAGFSATVCLVFQSVNLVFFCRKSYESR
jgi:hypothetical protein